MNNEELPLLARYGYKHVAIQVSDLSSHCLQIPLCLDISVAIPLLCAM